MTPPVAHRLQQIRTDYDGDVHVLKDFDTAAAILLTPRGQKPPRTFDELLAFCERYVPPEQDMTWEEIAAMREPFLLLINPALSGPPPGPAH